MKVQAVLGALAAASFALPAAAQGFFDVSPQALLHHVYVEGEGGYTTEGRSKIDIEALADTAQSASHSDDAFGGALIGFKVVQGFSVEGEGFYSRDRLSFSPSNPVLGIGGATRLYGGLGNVRVSLPFVPTYVLPLGAHSIPIGVEPYIATGIGRGNIQFTGRNGAFGYETDQNGFIWQGKAGVEFKVGEHVGLDVAYRYIQAPDSAHPDNFNSPGYSALVRSNLQAVTGGLKFYF